MKNKTLILSLFLAFLFQNIYSQELSLSEKSIKQSLSKSGSHFLNLENGKSLQHANNALEQAIQLNENELAAKAYNLIGLNFNEFSDPKKAIEYYEKGIYCANKTNNDTIKGWLFNNLANTYSYKKIDFKQAIKYYKQGLLISEKLNDDYEITFSKLNIVTAYFSMGDYKSGIVYLNEVKEDVDSGTDLEAKLTLNALYADYFNFRLEDDKAEEYYLKVLEYCSQNDVEFVKTHVLNAYKDISNFYFRKKDFQKAYSFLKVHDSLQDQVFSEQRALNVNTEGNKIEQNEINRKLEQIENEKNIQDVKLKNTKTVVILFFIIFVILFLFLFLLIKSNKQRENYNLSLQAANTELQIAKEKAEEASNIKSQFVSTISHELRTPLYGVIGITDIIAEEHKELHGSKHLKALKFSAKYLLALVNDILKVYKIEEHKVVLENADFNLEEELETIVDSLQILANRNQNKLIVEFDKKIPEFLHGDKIRLSQILINLVSNSLKFTKNGVVTIKTSVKEFLSDNVIVNFEIIDNGIGIPKEFQDKVFDKFVQIDRKEDDFQGTGLGLTIVKKLVELFKGQIYLESQENKGTTFTVIIPFAFENKKIKDKIVEEEANLLAYKILIVEDNKINQIVTKTLLEKYKFNCTIVDDGYQAIELLKTIKFDAILMDINMPKINGFETSKIIRATDLLTPIIAVTAFDKLEIEEKLQEAQINDVIVKPFEPIKLLQIINKLVK
uniref:ATP-binding protein n=1 Tax=Flavobacterium sp. TaxID=239 RepID=UPI00404AD1F7